MTPDWTVNVGANYVIPLGAEFSIWGKNIGNTAYARRLFSSESGDLVARTPGRPFGATVGVKL